MKRWGVWVLVVGVAAVAAGSARAQGPRGQGFGGGNSLTFLAGQKSVQEELKMTDDQVAKVKEFSDKQRQDRGGGQPNASPEERARRQEERTKAEAKAMADILKPEQLKRLKQISWQREGARAVARDEVADALKLSPEQKDKVKTIQEDVRKEMAGLRGGGGNREEARKKMEELQKGADEKLNAVLTDEQKTKLKELTGEPFKGEIQAPQRRRPQQTGN